MIQEIVKYKSILASLEELISNSPLKKGFIIEASGIPAPTFYRKLKSLSFTADETLKIVKILNPEEANLQELKDSINRGKTDYKYNRIHTRESVLNEINTILE